MKRLYILFAGLLFLTTVAYSQSSDKPSFITGNIVTDVNNLLPDGKVTADAMNEIKQTPRQAELTEKFQKGIQKNYEWFVAFMKSIPEGQPMPYHRKLGMTKKEYKELEGYFDDIELVSSGKKDITIINDGNIIQFVANGNISMLNLVKIDLKKNVVFIGEYELPFSRTINVETEDNPLKSIWKGYAWELETTKNIDLGALKDLPNLHIKKYEFTIGKLEKTGKTFMSVKCHEVENGVAVINVEIPLIF